MKKSGTSLLDSVKGAALLHRGGEASIYLLNVGGAPYVLKWYKDGFSFDESVVERACKVREPGLYRIEEWGNRDGTPYLIYDYIDGESSETLGRMPVAVAIVVLRQVASALAALHKQGVSHGDLSPANVIFAVDGEGGGNAGLGLRTVLIDCGIVGPGALAYAAPERFQGKPADEKSDLFSLGLLLYRWIAGEDLITAAGYEQFAEQMANVQDLNISESFMRRAPLIRPKVRNSFRRWSRFGQGFSVRTSRTASKTLTSLMKSWKLHLIKCRMVRLRFRLALPNISKP